MTKSIFVDNIPDGATETQIQELFAKHGTVCSVTVIKDRETGEPRGFGFVEMDEAQADDAIQHLNGVDFLGQNLRVVEPISLSDSQH